MSAFLNEFELYLAENELSKNTIASYVSDVKIFFINNNELTAAKIKQYIQQLHDAGLSIKTINRKIVSIKQYIDFLNERKNAQLIIKIRQIKEQQQNYLDDMLTEKDFNSLVRSAEGNNDIRAKTIFCTLYYTGMRVSEMLQLHIDDIGRRTITIRGKGGKHREVFISKKLQNAWKEYLKVRLDTANALFTGERGAINRQTVDSIIKYHAGQIKLKLTKAHAHNFRHLFCKTMLEKGLSIDTVADLAGHSDINTTRIYTRKTKKELLAAIETI